MKIPDSRKCKSFEMILTNSYISKHVIMHVLGCGHEISNEIFDFIKGEELKNAPTINGNKLNVRPTKVPSKLFFKLMDIDRNHVEKQYNLLRKIHSDSDMKKDETSQQAKVTS